MMPIARFICIFFLACPLMAESPNVILMMTDDQGIGDFGIMGNELIETPNIDALAARSGTVDAFYVSPVCSPTRASLMTGRYNQRTRCIDTWLGRSNMDSDEFTLAEALKQAGYATGLFGKWHLGDCYPMRPQDQGFDKVLMLRGGGLAQPSEPLENRRRYTNPILFDETGKTVQTKGFCTDVYFDAAMRMIEEVAGRKPFFIYLPTLLEACGAKPGKHQLDGTSFLGLLTGSGKAEWPERKLVIQTHRGPRAVKYHHFMIREGDWKLLNASGFGKQDFVGEPKWELYNLKDDPKETNNLAERHPEVLVRLKKAYEEWFVDVSSTRPDNYAPPSVVIGTGHENPTVLTRQDWSGSSWEIGSTGYWEVDCSRSAKADIEVIFHPDHVQGESEVTLRIDEQKLTQRTKDSRLIFRDVQLPDGRIRLEGLRSGKGRAKAAWQLVVSFH